MTTLTIELEYPDDIPEELHDEILGTELEHVMREIDNGNREGELLLSYNDGESQYRGWWRRVWS